MAAMALRFRSHQRRILRLTEELDSFAECDRARMGIDRLVVGSDQVWNTIHGQLDHTYFLQSISKDSAKFSYAASFGGRPDDTLSPKALDQLATFETISVREPSGAEWLRSHGLQARVDVDPVMLQTQRFWSEFGGPRDISKPYGLVYQLHTTTGFDDTAKSLASYFSVPLRQVSADAKRLRPGRWRPEYLPCPERFVRLIRDAEFVVTDSYHGTVFSLLFGTPVAPVMPHKNRARIEEMLSSLAEGSGIACEYVGDAGAEIFRTSQRDVFTTAALDSWNYLRKVANPTIDGHSPSPASTRSNRGDSDG